MKTILFLSTSIDGLISDQQGIPNFGDAAWPDWAHYVNEAGSVIAGRSSFEQVESDDMGTLLKPEHKIVLSTKEVDVSNTDWKATPSPTAALELLQNAGAETAIIGGGRSVAYAFMKENLIDEIVIDLQPVAFGAGTPMFGDVLDKVQLSLISTTTLASGALRLQYAVIKDA